MKEKTEGKSKEIGERKERRGKERKWSEMGKVHKHNQQCNPIQYYLSLIGICCCHYRTKTIKIVTIISIKF